MVNRANLAICQELYLVLLYYFRVTAGYILSLGTMMFIVLCDVQLRLFSDEMSYRITLAAVGVIALGCTGQCHIIYIFFNNVWADICPIFESEVPLFYVSGDISSGL